MIKCFMIDGDRMRMNNKGFAISTLIYGLAIMGMMLIAILMGIMSVNRTNNRSMAQEVEEELTKYSQTDTVFSSNISGPQQYTVQSGESGWYRIELWGASGGNGKGLGAYTSGVIELEEEDRLYFFVGKAGDASHGGGSTDVRLINNSTPEGYQSRIMVAAGGGSGTGAHGGTLVGYKSSMVSPGGRLNITGTKDYNLISSCKNLLCYPDGTNYQLSGLNNMNVTVDASPVASVGGSGYLSSTDANVGGTSYIAGYPGSKGISSRLNEPVTVTNDPGHVGVIDAFNEDTGELEQINKMFYFVDGIMFAGINNGEGKAKIERVVRKTNENQKLSRRNNKLDNVTSITDCVGAGEEVATRISAVVEGREVAGALTGTGQCRTVSVNQVNGHAPNLDEIAVWHKAGKDYKDHTISVVSGGATKYIKVANSGAPDISETETPVGFHISAYQPDFTEPVPVSGNYYILPVLSENKVFTAQLDSNEEQNPIKLEYVNGYKRQKWSIELVTKASLYDPSHPYVAGNQSTYEYKIVELARFRAMDIKDTENKERNPISATREFNSVGRNDVQMWKITAIGDGTYVIKTAKERFTSSADTGNIVPQLTPGMDHEGEVIIGINNNVTERFRLIAVDYSSA